MSADDAPELHDDAGLAEAARAGDAEMELAAAIMSVGTRWRQRKSEHLERALAAAKLGSLLARNLVRQRDLLGLEPAVVARLTLPVKP